MANPFESMKSMSQQCSFGYLRVLSMTRDETFLKEDLNFQIWSESSRENHLAYILLDLS